jgi:hypothetical protein
MKYNAADGLFTKSSQIVGAMQRYVKLFMAMKRKE